MQFDIIKKIPALDDQKLLALFQNATRLKSKEKYADNAVCVLKAISEEWGKRLKAAENNHYKAMLPNIGMLKTLGYAVGNDGVKAKLRREILDYVMAGALPIVASPAYTSEWGKPLTLTRLHKLRRSLCAFIDGAQRRSGMEKAIIEWMEDLEYLDAQYT